MIRKFPASMEGLQAPEREKADWEKASWLSRISYHYIGRVMMKAWRSELEMSDFGVVAQRQSYEHNKELWKPQLEKMKR
jgi:hypothetical protein